MDTVDDPKRESFFRRKNRVKYHVAITEDDSLKIQCVIDFGGSAFSVEPRADNSITLTTST